jgi:hypothetical protein
MNRKRDRSQMVPHGMKNHPGFQPQPTTVHNVELIHGYFSSGDDEANYGYHRMSIKNNKAQMMRQGGYAQPMNNRQQRMGYFPPQNQPYYAEN